MSTVVQTPAEQSTAAVATALAAADAGNTDALGDTTPNVSTTIPTAGQTLPTAGEPAATGAARGVEATQAAWQTVFGASPTGQATNQLMDKVAVIRGTQDDQGAQDATVKRGLTSSSSALTAATVNVSNGLPPGTLTANADGSITTPGGYTVYNDGNHQWRVQEPDGTQHRIWGDPHVDEGNDGTNDWSFDTDASFILGDGTKIFCDTDKVSTLGGKDVTTSDMLKIQYQDSLGTMNVATGGAGTVGTGALSYDRKTADGATFVLDTDHRFVDGKTLGSLYDAGGDFAVDVDTSHTGTISDNARIALQNSLGTQSISANLTPERDVSTDSALRATGPSLSQMVANAYSNVNAQDTGERRQPTTSTSTSTSSAKTASASGFNAAANALTTAQPVTNSSDAEAATATKTAAKRGIGI